MLDNDLSRRILGSFEHNGRKYVKIFFVLPKELLDYLLDLVDIFGGVDVAIEKSIMMTHDNVTNLSHLDKEQLDAQKQFDKDIGELKEMVRRLENRIREVVSEILSRANISVEAVAKRAAVERRETAELELPDLVVAEGKGGEEETLSLDEAIAKAVVVAIDEELENVLEEAKEKNSGE